ncbi:MAG: phosphotransferase [Nocardioides sp.]
MREPPPHVSDAEVLATVRAHWSADIDAVTHLPVGFGAHHWEARVLGTARVFVTLDGLGPRHSAASLEATYTAAAVLTDALDFVVAPLPAYDGSHTVPLAEGAVSVTRWIDGSSGAGPLRDRAEAEATAAMLARLHGASPPAGALAWKPLVNARYAAELALALGRPWDTGPYGEHARRALSDRIEAIGRWVAAYHRLAAEARARPWVPTHGEPHSANQMVTPMERVLVDWESLRVAPAERDLRVLVQDGYADQCGPAWDMVEMFDLEWRLDEIASYARWFAAPHQGTASDEVAWGGLRGELERAEWSTPTKH